jgi:hypothetical protein
MVITSGFHPDDAGSIPATCSTKCKVGSHNGIGADC